jgi:hypothetical protein
MKAARCTCSACGEVFAGVPAFDLHRIGSFTARGSPRRCLSRKRMQARGMQRDVSGQWTLPLRTTIAPWYGPAVTKDGVTKRERP